MKPLTVSVCLCLVASVSRGYASKSKWHLRAAAFQRGELRRSSRPRAEAAAALQELLWIRCPACVTFP